MIATITASQQAAFDKFIADKLQIARSTRPLDKGKCEDVVTRLYAKINLPPPKCIFASSPLMGVMMAALINDETQLGNQLRNQLENQNGTFPVAKNKKTT